MQTALSCQIMDYGGVEFRYFFVFSRCVCDMKLKNDMLKKLMLVVNWVRNHKYLSVTIVFLAIVLVFDDNNMFRHIENQTAISELEDEIAQMKRDSTEIMLKQAELDGNGDVMAVEKLARDRYGMHKSNEDVFIMVEENEND